MRLLNRGSVPYILLTITFAGLKILFVIPKCLLNRGLLNQGSTVE